MSGDHHLLRSSFQVHGGRATSALPTCSAGVRRSACVDLNLELKREEAHKLALHNKWKCHMKQEQ